MPRVVARERPEPPDRDSPVRKPRFRVLPEASWGTHICVFYETKQDLVDANVSYFAAGLEANEFCIWATSNPVDREDAIRALRQEVPRFDEYLSTGRIESFLAANGISRAISST
jgi:hypothetical protein